jgi:hypothetical protein
MKVIPAYTMKVIPAYPMKVIPAYTMKVIPEARRAYYIFIIDVICIDLRILVSITISISDDVRSV